MKDNLFIDVLKAEYSRAHDLRYDKGKHNIVRGMGHAISGFAEDIFARYIADILNSASNNYFVDKVLSFYPQKGSKAKSIKPDLLIVKDNLATHYYDVKTNLGRLRDASVYLHEKNELISNLRGSNAWITRNKRHEIEFEFSQNLKYEMVVLFGWNINSEQLAGNQRISNDLKNVEMYVLFTENEETGAFEVNESAFRKLKENALKRK